jgi:hypothetical protein
MKGELAITSRQDRNGTLGFLCATSAAAGKMGQKLKINTINDKEIFLMKRILNQCFRFESSY